MTLTTNYDPASPASIEVSPAEAQIAPGETVQLAAKVTSQDGKDLQSSVNWTSLGSAAATVDGAGLVTGVADGSATIVARIGNHESFCQVKVTTA